MADFKAFLDFLHLHKVRKNIYSKIIYQGPSCTNIELPSTLFQFKTNNIRFAICLVKVFENFCFININFLEQHNCADPACSTRMNISFVFWLGIRTNCPANVRSSIGLIALWLQPCLSVLSFSYKI